MRKVRLMKKILLGTAAFVGIALATMTPAHAADGLSLELGGYAAGYVVYTDDDALSDVRKFDLRKDTEIYLSAETALDNGLTVGAHLEVQADRGDNDGVLIEKSYIYMSGDWGRVNLGEEDGVAYLMQVAAPFNDSKVDGLRLDIGTFSAATGGTISYATDDTGYSNKVSYFTPILNGFQAGVSFTPTIDDVDGISVAQTDNDADDFENAMEGAMRYQGTFEGVDVALGGGYIFSALESDGGVADDDRHTWNVGANVGIADWDFGASYSSTNNGIGDDGNTDILATGVTYTIGAYKLGVTYLNLDSEGSAPVADADIDRYTAGVSYEYGPGMSFRSAVQYQDAEIGAAGSEGYQVTLGTVVNF